MGAEEERAGRHSFFGFAGPNDGARGKLTRQGVPLFPHFETKRAARGRMQKKPRALGAARGEVGGPRGVAIATQRCDSATPSFIPPLNNKRRAAPKPPSACSAPKQKAAEAAPTACGLRGPSWPGKSNLARRSTSAPDRLRKFLRQPGIPARLLESSEAVPSS
jgi:hypothetical protein